MGLYKDQMLKTSDKDQQCKLCTVQKLEGSEYCPAHGGHAGHQNMKEEQRRLYRIARYQERMGEFSESSEARSYREEIGQLRTLLEMIWNSCESEADVILKTPQIVQVTDKVISALQSVEKLDREIGKTRTEEQLIEFLEITAEVISHYVTDPDQLAELVVELGSVLKGKE